MVYNSRRQAGRLLGEELRRHRTAVDAVFGLTRGGVAVAKAISRIINKPFYPLIVKKISLPFNPEFAVGAIAEIPGGGDFAVWRNSESAGGLEKNWWEEQIRIKKGEIAAGRKMLFRDLPERWKQTSWLMGKMAALTDDGAATGATMLAAIKAIHLLEAKAIVALPIASPEAASIINGKADKLIVLHQDPLMSAVSQAYRSFNQVSWEEVREMLR